MSDFKDQIRDFLCGTQRVLVIKYTGEKLNIAQEGRLFWTKNPLVTRFNILICNLASKLPACEFKNKLYRLVGVKIGREVAIAQGANLDALYPELITIHDGAVLGRECVILTHETTVDTFRLGRVEIGKQAMIGVRSVIRSGVKIGEGSQVGACSFVNKDVGDFELAGGVPVRTVKSLR